MKREDIVDPVAAGSSAAALANSPKRKRARVDPDQNPAI